MRYICAILSALFIVLVAGCGGTPAKPQPITITAADVSSTNQIGQTWTFKDGYGDTMWVDVQPGPSDIPGSIIWHYTKDNARGYWGLTAEGAELWFELDPDPANDNGWYNTTFRVIFRGSCIWGDWCTGPKDETITNTTTPGKSRPYLIVPPRGDNQTHQASDTTFRDFGNPNTHWRTEYYVEDVDTPAYKGPALVSEQWEGCVHEKWDFAPNGIGLVKVMPIDSGNCQGLTDPVLNSAQLTMVRIK